MHTAASQLDHLAGTPKTALAHISAKGTFETWVCSSSRGKDGNPANSKHKSSAYNADLRTSLAKAGFRGWMEICETALSTQQHLPFQKDCIYSTNTTSTTSPAAALYLNSRRRYHIWSFWSTHSPCRHHFTFVLIMFLFLLFTCRCPIYQTSVDTACARMVASQHNFKSSSM